MRRHLAVFAVCALFGLHSATFADDGRIPTATLQQIGLGHMQALSDADGTQIRGMSSSDATALGLSTVSLLVLDPSTGSNVITVNGTNVRSSAENGGGTQASTQHVTGAGVALNVTTPSSNFTGVIVGGAGGTAHASGH